MMTKPSDKNLSLGYTHSKSHRLRSDTREALYGLVHILPSLLGGCTPKTQTQARDCLLCSRYVKCVRISL